MKILGVNHRLPILNQFKIMVHIYTTGKTIHPFSIGYMINTLLQFKTYSEQRLKNVWVVTFQLGK